MKEGDLYIYYNQFRDRCIVINNPMQVGVHAPMEQPEPKVCIKPQVLYEP